MKTFDLIVIGAGSGGLNVASFMNRVGLRVLLISKSEEGIGGDCLNTGCVPSKALIHIARIVRSARKAERFGLAVSGDVTMKKVAEYIASKQDDIRARENKEYFEEAGMTVVIGHARFASKNSIIVNGIEYAAHKIILATGSRPRILKVPGIEKVVVLTNESIFALQRLPKDLLVVGGGPIGIELGQAFGHLGSRVTVLVKEKRILPREDVALALVVQREMEREGVRFLFEASLERIDDGTTAVVRTSGGAEHIPFDGLLAAIGRELNVEDLDLEKAGIELNERKAIAVNAYLETSNKNVLLCGDVVGQHQFTHAAELHAGLIVRNFFRPLFKKKLNADSLSWVTYTTPELATFGLSERDLINRRISHRVLEESFVEDDRAVIDEATYGKVKLFVSPKGVLLGGSVVAPGAGELIQELILAQSRGMNISALFSKIYPYPTAARINKRVVSNSYQGRLTPLVKRLLRILYR